MGWTFTTIDYASRWSENKVSISDLLIRKCGLNGDDGQKEYRVLKSAHKLDAVYMAYETRDKATGQRDVTALVFLVRMIPKAVRENFGWKGLSESMSPRPTDCPRSILELLTDPAPNDDAMEWRKLCWEKVRQREAISLSKGDRLLVAPPIRFLDGAVIGEFIIHNAKASIVRDAKYPEFGQNYKIDDLRGKIARGEIAVQKVLAAQPGKRVGSLRA